MKLQGLPAVRETLMQARRVLLVPHVGLDGDDLGCMIALHRALEVLGKEPVAFAPDPIPEAFRGLIPGLERLQGQLPEGPFDAVVCLECPAPARLPRGVERLLPGAAVVNLDHHLDNDGYGDVLWVEPEAAALGEMVFDLLEALSVPLDSTIANGLYVSLFTDTGSFQYSRVSPGTHRRVARLLEHGVRTDLLGRRLFREEPFESLRLLGTVLGRLQPAEQGRVSWSEIRRGDLVGTGLTFADVRPFVERIDQVRGGEVTVLFHEQGERRVKVSLRSRRVPVNGVAGRFGGGGHVRAAGCVLELPLAEAREAVLAELALLDFGVSPVEARTAGVP